jgi:hypothetical protein
MVLFRQPTIATVGSMSRSLPAAPAEAGRIRDWQCRWEPVQR